MKTISQMMRVSTILAFILASLISVALPSGYFVLGYQDQKAVLETEANMNAMFLSRTISESPEYWQYEHHRLSEVLASHTSKRYNELRSIFDANKAVVAQSGSGVVPPFLSVSHALYDSGNVVGRLEITSSLRPLIKNTLLASVFAFVLGFAVFATLRLFPLRALAKAMQSVYEEKEKAQAILNNIPDIAWLKDREDRYIAANGPFCKTCGVDADELPGMTDLELWPRDLAEQYRADDREVMETGRPKQIEEPIIDTEGRKTWILTIKTPIFNDRGGVIGTTGIARDFTERKLMEEALRESEERFRSVVDNVGIGIALISPKMEILSLNKQMKEWSPAIDVSQKPICFRSFNRPPKEEICSYCPTVKTLKDGLVYEAVTETPVEGGIMNLRVVSSPLKDSEGNVIAAIELVENITERKKAEHMLAEKENFLSRIIDSIQDGISILDTDLRVVRTNHTIETWLHDRLPFKGRKCYEAYHGRTGPCESCPSLRTIQSGKPDFRIFPIMENGSVKLWLEQYTFPLFDPTQSRVTGVIEHVRDITGRKLAEDEMLRRNTAVGRLSSALVALSKNERIYKDGVKTAFMAITETSANAMDVCRVSIWFYTEGHGDLKCMDLYEINSGAHSEGFRLAASAYPAYFSAMKEEHCIAADNAVEDPRTREFSEAYLKPLGITSMLDVPVRIAGKVVGVVCHEHVGAMRKWTVEEQSFVTAIAGFTSVAIESHERIKGDEEIRKLNRELELKVEERTKQLLEAQEELVRKEKLSILGQLAGSVGHELRNPLGVMNNAIYFLKTVLPESDNTVREYLNMIKSEIDNSERIISDLLDFSRTKTPQMRPMTVNDLIDQSLGKCVIPEKVEVRLEVSETLPPIKVDPLQMVQVFQNLITNACQAMPEGGELRASARTGIRDQGPEVGKEKLTPAPWPSAPDGDFLEISVTDTGEGIAPENMKKLFQPLFTTKAKGIGLGLVVCRNLTEANGGRLEVESELGKGTTFTVTLPAADKERQAKSKS